MRSVFDIIAGVNAPIAPGGDAEGWLLADADDRECRFPIGHDGGTRFCAMEVSADDWKPGKVNGCYCAFHTDYLSRQPRGTESERSADRVLLRAARGR